MKQALIFYLWGKRNAGDMAICLGAASLLIQNDYKVTFVSRFAQNQSDYHDSKEYIQEYFEDVNVEPGIFDFDREDTKPKQLLSYIKSGFKFISPLKDKRIETLIENSDIIFMNGGNLLRGKNMVDYARLIALFYPFKIAKKHNKRLICMPQSTAESSKLGMKLLENQLSGFEEVFIRERNSYEVLTDRIKNINFIRSTDVGFYITDNKNVSEKYKNKYYELISNKNKNIALILRSTTIGDLGELTLEKKEEFIKYISKFVFRFKSDYKIFLVVQTLKDKKFTENVLDRIGLVNEIKIIEEYDSYLLREIYKNMEFILAMRLHAAILSMTANTPVVGYFDSEWGLKNPGIMDDVGMPWTSNGDKLIGHAQEVITNKSRYQEKIRNHIDTELRNITEKI